MDNGINKKRNKGGRKPKLNPSKNRHVFRLTDEENARFLTIFENSGMKNKAKFIVSVLLQKEIKVIKTDMPTLEFHIQLTKFFTMFRNIGVNYNQIVKIIYRNFSEKKAAAYLFKLEKQTTEMAALCKQIMQLTLEFEAKYILNNEKK